jgi:hypothetical protein
MRYFYQEKEKNVINLSMKKRIFLSVFLIFFACSSSENGYEKGRICMQKLTEELKQIDTLEQLEAAIPHLKKRFNEIADVLIEIQKSPNTSFKPSTEVGDELFAQLARLYEIPGGKQLIERAQIDAIQKLKK